MIHGCGQRHRGSIQPRVTLYDPMRPIDKLSGGKAYTPTREECGYYQGPAYLGRVRVR